MTQDLIKAEFHTHTVYSPDSMTSLKEFLSVCKERKIERVAITDHNTMEGAFKAKEMDPERVILGEEIETTQGEILGYFMTKQIPWGLKPREVVERLREQGAFISVAHPFDPHRGSSWAPGELEAILPYLDGIEVFNARCVRSEYNEDALAFAQKYNKFGMAGSDAHSSRELGRAAVLLPPFNTAEELREAMRSSTLEARLSSPTIHLISTWAKFAKKLKCIQSDEG